VRNEVNFPVPAFLESIDQLMFEERFNVMPDCSVVKVELFGKLVEIVRALAQFLDDLYPVLTATLAKYQKRKRLFECVFTEYDNLLLGLTQCIAHSIS
jgi:hypothetical protein